MNDLIIRSISRLIIPFIQIYGIYIVINGHLSPGGGFAGGTVIAASFILYALAFNLEAGKKRFPHRLSLVMESGGVVLFVLIGLVGLLRGAGFLANKSGGFPLGLTGNLFSSGAIILISCAIGTKVASTMITLFLNLAGEDERHDADSD